MSREIIVGVRLTKDEIAQIDKMIDEGDFATRAECARYFIRKGLLAYQGKRIGIKFDGQDFQEVE